MSTISRRGFALSAVALAATPLGAQEKPRKSVSQGWMVYPGVLPENLLDTLERINKDGYYLAPENIKVVGEAFFIVLPTIENECEQVEGEN